MEKEYLQELNKQQYEAATTIDGPMLILAGAGSGKTKTLVHRVAYMADTGIPPESILLVTFTNKAANEMKERVKKMLESRGIDANIEASTFHSFCAKMLRKYGDATGIDTNFTIITPEDEADAVNIVRVELGYIKTSGLPKPKQIVGYISASLNKKTELDKVLPNKYISKLDTILEIKKGLEKYKEEKNYFSYDDILVAFANMLRRNKRIQEQIERNYRYIMVDEYQDTNMLQDEILSLLRKNNHNLVVVGDDMQSIYGFRGAEVQNIIQFPTKVKNCKTITLKDNYRSTQKILDLANHITKCATEGFPKALDSKTDGGIKPVIVETIGQQQEASAIIDIINKLIKEKNVPMDEICVLARQTVSFYLVEMELVKNGIPYEKRGGVKFMDKAHIKDTTAFLRLLANQKDELSWFRILQLLEGIGEIYAREIAADCTEFGYEGLEKNAKEHNARKYAGEILRLKEKLEQISGKELSEAVSEIIQYYLELRTQSVDNATTISDENKANMYDAIEDAKDDLEIFKEIASSYNDLNAFLDDIVLNDNLTTLKDGEGIILSTVHSVKGLEFNTIILMDCMDGIFPSSVDIGSKEDNEELRCFYVAVTRAKERLILLYPKVAKKFGDTIQADISHYLEGSEELCDHINY